MYMCPNVIYKILRSCTATLQLRLGFCHEDMHGREWQAFKARQLSSRGPSISDGDFRGQQHSFLPQPTSAPFVINVIRRH